MTAVGRARSFGDAGSMSGLKADMLSHTGT